MKSRTCLVLAAIAVAGCVSTTVKGYPGGKLKYSEIRYDYVAKPVLTDPQSKTYRVMGEGSFRGISSVGALDKKGVKKSDGDADVAFRVAEGPINLEPGGFGMKEPYKPALTAKMPIEILVKDKTGRTIVERKSMHEDILILDAGAGFKTREEAKKAMTQLMEAGAKAKAEEKVRQGASGAASKNLDLLAKDLFEPRKVSVTLPALRAAGGVDMENAYLLLSKAKGEAQVKEALAAYSALGTDHKNADGSPDVVANYGVLCGLASAKILTGDLSGAWQDTKGAWGAMPTGEEHRRIAQVLHQQQEQAGVEIIPKEDYDAMVKADQQNAQDALKALFKKK